MPYRDTFVIMEMREAERPAWVQEITQHLRDCDVFHQSPMADNGSVSQRMCVHLFYVIFPTFLFLLSSTQMLTLPTASSLCLLLALHFFSHGEQYISKTASCHGNPPHHSSDFPSLLSFLISLLVSTSVFLPLWLLSF